MVYFKDNLQMNKLSDLEEYAKEIGLIKNDDNFNYHYQYWDVVSKWKTRCFLKLIPSYIKPKKIIELGCGYGLLLRELAKKFKSKSVVGIDHSQITLKMAEKLNPHILFIKNDACHVQVEDNSFDLVILSDIIEHINHPEILLKESQRISRFALMKIPLEKCLRTIYRKYDIYDSAGHLFCLNEKETLNLLKNSGYKVLTKITSPKPKELYIGKEFINQKSRFLIQIIKKLLMKHFRIVHTYIFGDNLFAFCKINN